MVVEEIELSMMMSRLKGLLRGVLLLVAAGVLAGCGDEAAKTTSTSTGGAANPPTEEQAEHPGKKIYNSSCFSCHAVGLSGAPKFGDVEAWAPRIAKLRRSA